ncbi:sulfurtransferase [Chitinolyticbacter albus]|uniref:sulfurtransferase n=1 Tax=Chitinolyticbacter albus TaxID=2961951 RepID=UPI00210BBC27|nr:sulfurtransferase [Chitinolyticbacter albus]
MSPLITVTEALAAAERIVFIDCRHSLADPDAGARAYAEGHLPGAVFAHLDHVLSGPRTGRNGRHPLPDPEGLAVWLGEQGITADSHIVAYDDAGGMFAARCWWLLRWLGHRGQVAVLDGGIAAWRAAGGVLTNTAAQRGAGTYVPALHPDVHVDASAVLANLDTAQFTLVDARSAERYAGVGETLDAVGGHIPGALNRFFQLNLEGGRFKPASQLRDEWLALLAGRDPAMVVHQCGSGVTACHNLLALAVANLEGGRLYPGSWSEWCSDPDRPVDR